MASKRWNLLNDEAKRIALDILDTEPDYLDVAEELEGMDDVETAQVYNKVHDYLRQAENH